MKAVVSPELSGTNVTVPIGVEFLELPVLQLQLGSGEAAVAVQISILELAKRELGPTPMNGLAGPDGTHRGGWALGEAVSSG